MNWAQALHEIFIKGESEINRLLVPNVFDAVFWRFREIGREPYLQ